MSTVYRANRKATDADIIRLNNIGLSLKTIAKALGCHPTSVTLRLKSLGIPPADTRRSFMEDIFLAMDDDQQVWLSNELNKGITVKDFVKEIILEKYRRAKP